MPPIRGLHGWLKNQDLIHDSQLGILKGSTIAIDALKFFQSQLARDIWTQATGIIIPEIIISMVNQQIDLFEKYEITPIFVFPGVSSSNRLTASLVDSSTKNCTHEQYVAPDDVSWNLIDKFADTRDHGWQEFVNNRFKSSEDAFAKIDRFVSVAERRVIKQQLKHRGCNVISAPYRVSAQLSILSRPPVKAAHACVGSIDLLLYGVNKLILEIDLVEGVVQWTQATEILQATKLTLQQLTYISCLAGYGICQTFPNVYEGKRFVFARILAVLQKYKSLQGVIDVCNFKTTVERIEAIRNINDSLDQLECGSALAPGNKIVSVRKNRTMRFNFTTQKNGPTEKVYPHSGPETIKNYESITETTPLPHYTLPSTVTTLLASGVVQPTTFNPVICGAICDSPVALSSSQELNLLLDSMADIRSQTLRLLWLALSNPTKVDIDVTNQDIDSYMKNPFFASITSSKFYVSNMRSHDQTDGIWPRPLVSTPNSLFTKVLIDATPNYATAIEKESMKFGSISPEDTILQIQAVKKLLGQFISLARNLDISSIGTVTLSNILDLVSAQNNTTTTSNNGDHDRILSVAVALVLLFLLEFIDKEGKPTSVGSDIASLNQKIAGNNNTIVGDTTILLSYLLRSECFHERRMMTRSCFATNEESYPTELVDSNIRILSRIATIIPVSHTLNSQGFAVHPTAANTTLDSTMTATHAHTLIDILRFMNESIISAFFLFGFVVPTSAKQSTRDNNDILSVNLTSWKEFSLFPSSYVPSVVGGTLALKKLVNPSQPSIASMESNIDSISLYNNTKSVANALVELISIHSKNQLNCDVTVDVAESALELSSKLQL